MLVEKILMPEHIDKMTGDTTTKAENIELKVSFKVVKNEKEDKETELVIKNSTVSSGWYFTDLMDEVRRAFNCKKGSFKGAFVMHYDVMKLHLPK